MDASGESVTILFVNTHANEIETLAAPVRSRGFATVAADGLPAGQRLLQETRPALVFLEMNGNKSPVLDFLARVGALADPPPVIVLATQARAEDATEIMRSGAHDFWLKPVPAERVLKTVQLLCDDQDSPACPRRLAEVDIVTRDPAVERLKAVARQVAPSGATVFIQGESGTGKELFARYVHWHSPRRHKPFIAVNCAALPDNLLESELFGHEKGAFTGASRTKKGKFELAHGGTILLDEVTEIPIHLQAKLLRVLQENEVDRVGGLYPVAVDVRVLATSNTAVLDAVRAGRFRADLYYRLNVIPLKIPPLRGRSGDVELLSEHFIRKYAAEAPGRDEGKVSLGADAAQVLRAHCWPGNVRELENVIHRAVLLSRNRQIDRDALILDEAPPVGDSRGGPVELTTVEEMERRLIHTALDRYQGNRTRAAEILGISVRTLRNKLQSYRDTGLLEAGV